MSALLFRSNLKSLPFLHQGKVRDLYAVGEDRLLVIQSDRLSAFDVVLDDPIPGKGEVLTALSFFWFRKLGHVIANHLTDTTPESVVAADEREQVAGRSMVVRKLKPLLVEGPAAKALIERAKSGAFDLIVMGSHGHGRLHQSLLGCVSQKVLHASPIPVLLTRAPAKEPAVAPAAAMESSLDISPMTS